MQGRFALLALICAFPTLGAAQTTDEDVLWKIRREAVENSQILATLHMLTDRYGPRLTGSPNLEAAGNWAADQMTSWGLVNAHPEPWEFGHPGWSNERLTAHIVSPVKDVLTGEVLAWTRGTDGPIRSEIVQIEVPRLPTKEELDAYLATVEEKVGGKIVLAGKPRRLSVSFDPPTMRRDDDDLLAQYDPIDPTPFRFPRRNRGPREDGRLDAQAVNAAVARFLADHGALLRVNDAARAHGQIRAFSNRTYDPEVAPPTLILRNEDYGRLSRLLLDGPVELEVDIVNHFYEEGKTAYNVIAEIPGTDKADEVVMLGGHLDSWHSWTGATDNAIGCTVMMEAARILKAIGVEPRRTIRVALWSGEEQGLRGSKAYVAQHFGSFEEPKPEFGKFAGYFNIDAGTGRARGATVFGPKEAADILRAALAPLKDLGVLGATTTESRRVGGSDHTSFNGAGLPGISMNQDPIEYGTHSWHTNLDAYERVIEGDAQISAIAVAAGVYQLAMRDERLPRFDASQMPEPPKPEGEDRPTQQ
jgi:carboxypeptidase Q